MHEQPELVAKKAKPLFFHKNVLYFSKKNKIYSIDKSGKENTLFKFKQSWINNFLDSFKLAYRARRSGVWSSIVFEDHFYFSFDRKMYCYDLEKAKLVLEKSYVTGRGPLQFSVIEGIAGFDKSLVYGDYFGNTEMKEISVYRKSNSSDWQTAFTFDAGTVNHIHSLVPDKYNDCVWILAGDFNQAASIWKASDNFNSVELIVSGEQKYRSCVAYPTAQGLIYATDSQFIDNTIRILKKTEKGFETETISSINGPAIYGAEHKNHYIFSTSTEPEMIFSKRSFKSLLVRKPASRIVKNQSDIVCVDKHTLKCTRVLSKKKDGWPFALFQFGVIMFPSGVKEIEKLYFYSIGSKKNDLCTEAVELPRQGV